MSECPLVRMARRFMLSPLVGVPTRVALCGTSASFSAHQCARALGECRRGARRGIRAPARPCRNKTGAVVPWPPPTTPIGGSARAAGGVRSSQGGRCFPQFRNQTHNCPQIVSSLRPRAPSTSWSAKNRVSWLERNGCGCVGLMISHEVTVRADPRALGKSVARA